jgi:pimeloyl-ACP methyl ester carboxylesterase
LRNRAEDDAGRLAPNLNTTMYSVAVGIKPSQLQGGTGLRTPRSGVPLRCKNAMPQRAHEASMEYIPAERIAEIREQAAIDMMACIETAIIEVGSLGAVRTPYVAAALESNHQQPAIVLLHGFDSSLLEYRRLYSLLATKFDVFVVDLVGWGFSKLQSLPNNHQEKSQAQADLVIGPGEKRQHLKLFCETVVQRDKVILLGASLGGTVAIDFAIHHPDMVEQLVLVDAQGLIDGIGPLATMPKFLSKLGVDLLRSVPLRRYANQLAYHDKNTYATNDAMLIGRLHTHSPWWSDTTIAFMQSGGYAVSTRLAEVHCPVLVAWGRQDKVLDPANAERFIQELRNAKLVWIEHCGHFPALEQPAALLNAVVDFVFGTNGTNGTGKKEEEEVLDSTNPFDQFVHRKER